MLSHTPSSLSEPDTPPRHTNSPLSAAEPCWTQRSRRREGPLGVKEGGGGGGVRKGSRRGGVEAVLSIPATDPSQVRTETKSYTSFFYLHLPVCDSFVLSKALFQLVCACVCTCGRRKWKRERDEVAQWEITDVSGTVFLFSGNLNLLQLLKESCACSTGRKRRCHCARVTNVNLVVKERRDWKEMHVEMSDCLTWDVSDELM